MKPLNLHTLDPDILYTLLTHAPDLTTLHGLILTHPSLTSIFLLHRRLILRTVYLNQHPIATLSPLSTRTISEFIKRIEKSDPHAGVALREALWPVLEARMPEIQSQLWARSLLVAYRRAELPDDAIRLARTVMDPVFAQGHVIRPHELTQTIAVSREVSRTHLEAEMLEDAMRMQKTMREMTRPGTVQHLLCSVDLVKSYRAHGRRDEVFPFLLECWELNERVRGAGNRLTRWAFYWARELAREYRDRGEHEEGLRFWERIRGYFEPGDTWDIIWLRYMMHLYKRQEDMAEALEVMEAVWRLMGSEVEFYMKVTEKLRENDASEGRGDEGIVVCEAAWVSFNKRIEAKPGDYDWMYQTRAAGLIVAKIYRKHGRYGEADVVEERCKEIAGEIGST